LPAIRSNSVKKGILKQPSKISTQDEEMKAMFNQVREVFDQLKEPLALEYGKYNNNNFVETEVEEVEEDY
jgi:hypothetical protein